VARSQRFREGFARLSGERVTFLSGKVTKAKRPARRFRRLRVGETALRFSRQAGRRELAHPCARTGAPCSRLALRCSASCKGAKSRTSTSAIHGLARSEINPRASPACARRMRAEGPLEHGERTTERSEGWPAGCGPVRRRHRDVPSANPGGRSRILSTGMCSGRVRGVAFLWATFLWPCKERWLARQGGGRKKTGTSPPTQQASAPHR